MTLVSDEQTLRAARILASMAVDYELASKEAKNPHVVFVALEIADALRRAEARILSFESPVPLAETERIRTYHERAPTQADNENPPP